MKTYNLLSYFIWLKQTVRFDGRKASPRSKKSYLSDTKSHLKLENVKFTIFSVCARDMYNFFYPQSQRLIN